VVALPSLRGYLLAVGAAVLVGLGAVFGVAALGPGGASGPAWPLVSGAQPPGLLSAQAALAPFPGAPAGGLGPSQRAALNSSYGRLPLTFEPNVGQADPRARYVARGAGYALFLTRQAAVLSLAAGSRAKAGTERAANLSIRFVGSNPRPTVSGRGALPGRINYMIGSDRSHWHTGIPTFSRVGYSNLWPGVGASFYGNQGRLEYDLTVAPGADPGRIGLSFGGASSVRVQRDGALRIVLPGGVVRQLRPQAYQVVGGVRHPVASRYVIGGGGRVGVKVGPYDRRIALVVDPVLTYSTYLGGSGDDAGNGIAVDLSGNAYITGSTTSTNFPTASSTSSPFQGANGGGQDAFVTKLTANGSGLVYSTYLGGSGADSGSAVAFDLGGNAYITGSTSSTNFPTASSTSPFQGSNGGGTDAFVTKLNPNGDGLVYSTYLGGLMSDQGNAIAVDFTGAAYVAGQTKSANFPTANPIQAAFGGTKNAFVTKVNPGGSGLVYSTYLGGAGTDAGSGIAVDSSGNAYVTGTTSSTNFPTASSTSSPFQGANAGGSDAFVTKLNPSGSGLVYSTYLGGANADAGSAIAVDGSGNAYVTGFTKSLNFPASSSTGSPFQSSNGGLLDAFVTKLNPTGSGLVYSTYLGGSGSDSGNGIAVDHFGNAYVAGTTNSPNFPTAGSPVQGSNAGAQDAFVTKLSPDGSGLLYSTYLGGSGLDQGFAIALDFFGGIYVTGVTTSSNFPTASSTASPFQGANGGGFDAFVAKISGPPVAATGTATGVTQTAATLNGSVSPNGDQTTYHFDVGPTSAYVFSTASVAVGSDSSFHAESQMLSGFAPGSTVHFRIVATNSSGTSFGTDQQFVTASTPIVTTTPVPHPQPPVVSGLDLTPKAFRAERSGPSAEATRPRGSRVSFTLSEPAVIAFTVQRRFTGRRVNGHCRRRTSRNRKRRRCTLFLELPGSFSYTGRPGANSFRFTGRLSGRRLKPQRYQLKALPTANGLQGRPATAGFRITRR
jgi:hypothetical protein